MAIFISFLTLFLAITNFLVVVVFLAMMLDLEDIAISGFRIIVIND